MPNFPIIEKFRNSKMNATSRRFSYILWTFLSLFLALIISLKLSPIQIIALAGLFSGIMAFILLTREDLSKGILIWLFSFVLFGQKNILNFANLPNFPVERILFAFFVLMLVIHFVTHRIKLLPITALDVVIFLFILICIYSMIGSGMFLVKDAGFRDFLNGFGVPCAAYFISKHVFDTAEKIENLFKMIWCIYIYLLISFILEKAHLHHLIPHTYFITDIEHVSRYTGPFQNAAACGTVLVIFFHALFFLETLMKGFKKTIIGLCGFTVPLLLFFTYTRSVWLSFAISLMFGIFLNRVLRMKYTIIFVCLALVALINLSNVLSSDRSRGGVLAYAPINSRIQLYDVYFELIKEKPLLGHGFGEITHKNISLKKEDIISHDSFMSVWVEMGFLGFSLYALIYIFLILTSLKLFRLSTSSSILSREYIIFYWAILINYILNCGTIEMRFFLFTNSLIFIFSGIICGEYQRIHKSGTPQ